MALIRAALVLLALTAAGLLPRATAAGDIRVGVSNRLDTAWSEPDNAVRVDDWMDGRAFAGQWEAHLRLRVALSTVAPEADSVAVDQRRLTLDTGGLALTAGTWYETVGRGFLLRAYENRFVTLARTTRAFSLDRDVDGVRARVRSDLGDVVAFSGRPVVTPVNGGVPDPRTAGTRLDLLQGLSGDARLLDGAVLLGGAVMGADRRVLANPRDPDPSQTLRSARAGAMWRGFTAHAEWADLRWHAATPGLPYGRALYGELTAAAGGFGASLEYKDYDRYSFPYAEPPTLVRTHQSILLNASTHVLKPTESGFQFEGVYSSGPEHTATLNLSRATSRFAARAYDFGEVYLEQRYEGEPASGFVFLDWSEDAFTGDRNRWTAGVSGNWTVAGPLAVFADVELQRVDPEGDRGDLTNGVIQVGVERAGAYSMALTYRWTTAEPFGDQRTGWLGGFGSWVLGSAHQLAVFAGSRAPGLVCAGGFCFDAPEFEGIEVRLLSAI